MGDPKARGFLRFTSQGTILGRSDLPEAHRDVADVDVAALPNGALAFLGSGGLLLYRGLARGITNDQSHGFGLEFKGLRSIATGRLPVFGEGDGVFHLPATTLVQPCQEDGVR